MFIDSPLSGVWCAVWPTDKISEPFAVLRSQAMFMKCDMPEVLIKDKSYLMSMKEPDLIATEHIGLLLNKKSYTDPKFFNTMKNYQT